MVPDLAGWRVDRVPDLPDENPLTVLPDWCEIPLAGWWLPGPLPTE